MELMLVNMERLVRQDTNNTIIPDGWENIANTFISQKQSSHKVAEPLAVGVSYSTKHPIKRDAWLAILTILLDHQVDIQTSNISVPVQLYGG
jgi:hypothetical protein